MVWLYSRCWIYISIACRRSLLKNSTHCNSKQCTTYAPTNHTYALHWCVRDLWEQLYQLAVLNVKVVKSKLVYKIEIVKPLSPLLYATHSQGFFCNSQKRIGQTNMWFLNCVLFVFSLHKTKRIIKVAVKLSWRSGNRKFYLLYFDF